MSKRIHRYALLEGRGSFAATLCKIEVRKIYTQRIGAHGFASDLKKKGRLIEPAPLSRRS
jgi:hypothetical protein